uniref:Uncharacterized protein n=1 Tax=Arundo donax TaxID=35708 RepID=A0A0A9A6Z3_ARUDO
MSFVKTWYLLHNLSTNKGDFHLGVAMRKNSNEASTFDITNRWHEKEKATHLSSFLVVLIPYCTGLRIDNQSQT